ncbi:MAG: MBL fold metallo-hydrolase [Bacillota bacterium]
MRIRYLGNSGFLLRLGAELMIFDCFNPERQRGIEDEIASAARATVFVSHAHRDHYSPAVRLWRRLGSVDLVFSSDIPPAPGVLRIAPGERVKANGLDVRAFMSTDEGVSFLIETAKCTIFHAGDLNNWHWQQENSPEEAREAEEAFLAVVEDIKGSGAKIDLAMFPVDPRMGTEYYRGALQFIDALRPKAFMPMHFGARFAPPKEFLERAGAMTRVLPPGKAGDEQDLNDCETAENGL